MTDLDDWDDEETGDPELADLFPGFESRFIAAPAGRIFTRMGGEGPPLLCLHGFPQSHVMWHKMAPELAKRFTLIVPDLRGYGWSTAPEPSPAAYAKREMGRDLVAVMSALGHARFSILGHDRGARAAYRLGLDQPGRVERLVLLDILPTYKVWKHVEAGRFRHWHDMTEEAAIARILGNPRAFLETTLANWSASGLKPFAEEALEHYARAIAVPERVAAMREDYRAGATLDRQADEADVAASKTLSAPTHLVWGAKGLIASLDPLDEWAELAPRATGEAVPGGHFPAEEAPDETLAAVLKALA